MKRSISAFAGAAAVIVSIMTAVGFAAPSGLPCQEGKAGPPELAASGKKNTLPGGLYFTWEFDRAPKMGTAILKVRVFDGKGKQITPFDVTGRSDMPSMRGGHDSGDVKFKLNKKGDYLLPVNIVMPGDWEVILVFQSRGTVVFRGRILFDV